MARGSPSHHRSSAGDGSSSGDSAGEWRYAMPRKKRARKTETVRTGARARVKLGAKGFERRSTNLEVILNAQRDSESEQHSDVDMVGADSGANGAAAASGPSVGTGVTSVTGEKKRARNAVWRGSSWL